MNLLKSICLSGLAWLALAGAPSLLRADITGADPRLSGAPGDQTCTSCHGTGQANANGGSVAISFANGATTYTPGQTTQVTVTVADPTAKDWGFELSPRLSSSGTTGAGTLAIGGDGYTKMAGTSGTLQWITHTLAGTRRGTGTSASFTFNWTAPSSNVGNVDFYVAANAGNNNNNDDSGDHIYTSKATLSAATATGGSGSTPTISSNGVVNAFSASTSKFAPGMWVTLYGSNLSTVTQQWAGTDFTNSVGPTTLAGVSATVNGQPAVLNYVSPTQVNIQIPVNAGTGTSSVVLTAPGGTSSAYSLNLAQFAPTLNQNAAFKSSSGKPYAVATFSDNTTFVGPTGLISGAAFRPATAGDTIILYGLGFGPLSTALATGQVASLDATANPVTVTINGVPATVSYAGAAPGLVGAYQLNVVVPANAGTGDVPIEATVGGVSTGQGLYITLQ